MVAEKLGRLVLGMCIPLELSNLNSFQFSSRAVNNRHGTGSLGHRVSGSLGSSFSGPLAWNSLPVALRSSDVTEETFRRHLKTFLFNCLDN